jgi:hypothetical protein
MPYQPHFYGVKVAVYIVWFFTEILSWPSGLLLGIAVTICFSVQVNKPVAEFLVVNNGTLNHFTQRFVAFCKGYPDMESWISDHCSFALFSKEDRKSCKYFQSFAELYKSSKS